MYYLISLFLRHSSNHIALFVKSPWLSVRNYLADLSTSVFVSELSISIFPVFVYRILEKLWETAGDLVFISATAVG